MYVPTGKNSSQSRRLFDSDDFTSKTVKVNCVLCKDEFTLPDQEDSMMSHIFQEHRLVIADRHLIASLKSYLDFWRVRFQENELPHFCSTFLADLTNPISGEVQKQQECYMLSDVLPEDRCLRERLQNKRLELVLEQQRIEREDSGFSRCCLFCRNTLVGTRATFLNHLSEQHNLQLGRPQNLVLVDRLLDHIEELINKFMCLFCEKIFKDRLILREHMRKKHHKRVNPKNKFYDQFYVVNYLELGKDWHQVEEEVEEPDSAGETSASEAEDDWADWRDTSNHPVFCLFCQHSSLCWEETLAHLESVHKFSFMELTNGLDFYQKVKLVNYIRKMVRDNSCISCQEQFPNPDGLMSHMEDEAHLQFPNKKLWDQPEFYFPTCEDDAFLCQLDDGRADDEGTPDCVISEDIKPEMDAIDAVEKSGIGQLRGTFNALHLGDP